MILKNPENNYAELKKPDKIELYDSMYKYSRKC